tara:strand:- start:4653 stop:6143 length:1491 start_codon:yes stop_codon:yes gene_type:complete
MNNRKFIAAISISALLFLSSCATNPVTGTPDFVTITEQQEISIGASYHEKILEENKVIENKELNDYFSKLGNEIARNSHRPDLKWTFTLIDSPTMNAFATPGGYVYMYRGMLNYFNSEAEFAGVIGHEIAHITARHAVRGMSTAQVTNLLLGIVRANVPGAQLTDNAFNLMNVIVNRGYSRKFELEADKLAAEYLLKNNYNPDAMRSFLKILEDSDDLERKIAKSENREPRVGYHGIFSTHPDNEKRIRKLESTKLEKKPYKDNKEKFLKMIDGSLYGSSPEEGYLKDSYFYHPILAIKFNIKDNWSLKNLPDKLVISKNESQLIMRADELLVDDLDNGLTPKEYLENGVSKTNFLNTNKLLEESDFSYNDLKGYTHLYENKGAFSTNFKRFIIIFDTQSKKLKPKAWISTITMKDKADDNDAINMLKSFQKMSEKEIADSKGLRIKVIRFREGMSYESLAKSSPLGKFSADKLRLLNGHYPNLTPEIGDLIKIVQ